MVARWGPEQLPTQRTGARPSRPNASPAGWPPIAGLLQGDNPLNGTPIAGKGRSCSAGIQVGEYHLQGHQIIGNAQVSADAPDGLGVASKYGRLSCRPRYISLSLPTAPPLAFRALFLRHFLAPSSCLLALASSPAAANAGV